MNEFARLDHQYIWHPFTQMRDWLRAEPIVLAAGKGAVLRDVRGREFLDANSSIWTNLHGHGHRRINNAIRRQLEKVAHTSALGYANQPASLLARQLAAAANPKPVRRHGPRLTKVFFSDDGSTAIEVALKLAFEFTRRTKGQPRPRFISLEGAYHGDTVGAVSLGHIDLFHKTWSGLLFPADKVPAPYCYRCPWNRARPERADARTCRQCRWECVAKLEAKFQTQAKRGRPYAAFVFEPLMQGAAGMIPQPEGWLRRATDIARGHGALLVADEVMTGFGRTGFTPGEAASLRSDVPLGASLFACRQESVQPDLLALAKGLTGGYLPMAATLSTSDIFNSFLGEYAEFKTFFHGHSFTANQLGASAGLASMELLSSPASIRTRLRLQRLMTTELQSLWDLPAVGDIRQVGLVAGIELVRNWATREPFKLEERVGIRVCEAMAKRGVLTRPVGNVIVLMPPYCTTPSQLRAMITALGDGIAKVARSRRRS